MKKNLRIILQFLFRGQKFERQTKSFNGIKDMMHILIQSSLSFCVDLMRDHISIYTRTPLKQMVRVKMITHTILRKINKESAISVGGFILNVRLI